MLVLIPSNQQSPELTAIEKCNILIRAAMEKFIYRNEKFDLSKCTIYVDDETAIAINTEEHTKLWDLAASSPKDIAEGDKMFGVAVKNDHNIKDAYLIYDEE